MNHILLKLPATLALITFIAAIASPLRAGSPSDTTSISSGGGSTTASDKVARNNPYGTSDDLGLIYHNSQNPILQKFCFTGDFQLQYASGDSNQGSFGSKDIPWNSRWGDIDVRRWRLGFQSLWFNDVKFTGVVDVNPRLDPFYKDIYDLSVTYAPNEAFNLGLGKTKAHWFSQEYDTPTRDLIIFEQALLVNTLVPQQLTGMWINGKSNNWVYALACYGGDYQNEFSHFDDGTVIQARVGYDFAPALKVDEALVKFDYQYSSGSSNSNGPAKFSDAFSLNTTYRQGRFSTYTDFLGGIGQGKQGDVYGLELTPAYFLIEQRLQLIFRYQYAHGDEDGLNLQKRYEALAPGMISSKGAGSEYNAAYIGLNYYIHGQNLKLMLGTEYNSMTGGKENYSGWTTLVGMRAYF